MKSDIEKQRHSSRTTIISQMLRGVTMKKVWWGRNKKPKFGNDAKLELDVFPHFFSFRLCICQDPRIARAYAYKNLRTSRLSRSAHVPDPDQVCGTDTAERGAFEPPPEDVFHSFKSCRRQSKTNKRSSPADVKQNKRSRVCHRKIQNIRNYRLEMMP